MSDPEKYGIKITNCKNGGVIADLTQANESAALLLVKAFLGTSTEAHINYRKLHIDNLVEQLEVLGGSKDSSPAVFEPETREQMSLANSVLKTIWPEL